MKKANLLLMIILLVFSQFSLSYQSVNAISNNESNSEDSSPSDNLNIANDDGIVQPNDSNNVNDFAVLDLGNGVSIAGWNGDKDQKDFVIPSGLMDNQL
ncbi:hypothetical protein [Lysinibacillus sp. NPDC059133]|uniref:hypothetical protein n=1 Tax=Lysinibacillus sp. NPDC059133 TaxID=3346737 RepID=UPI0036AE69F7